jgi:hypothetical protein
MTTIYLDPVAMRATAGAVAENAMRVQETVTGTRSACACDVPRSLIGWLDEELLALTVSAMEVAVAYLQAALDTVQRAQQIEADQSLVAAQADIGTVDVTSAGDLGAVLAGSSFVGGTGSWLDGMDSGPGTTTMWIGGTQGWLGGMDSGAGTGTTTMWIGPPTYENDPMMQLAIRTQYSNPGLSAQAAGLSGMLSNSSYEMNKTWLAPGGTTYLGNNLYGDRFGHQGDIGSVYPSRDRPGEYEVNP